MDTQNKAIFSSILRRAARYQAKLPPCPPPPHHTTQVCQVASLPTGGVCIDDDEETLKNTTSRQSPALIHRSAIL
jgi:hypothetical protein